MKPTRERESVETNIISKLLIRLKAIHKLDAIWLPRTFNYNSTSYARILWRLLLFSASFFFTFVHLNIGLSNEFWTTESNKYKWSKTKRNEDVIYNYRVLNWMVHLNACPFLFCLLSVSILSLLTTTHPRRVFTLQCFLWMFMRRCRTVNKNKWFDSSCVRSGVDIKIAFHQNQKLIDQQSFNANIYVDFDNTSMFYFSLCSFVNGIFARRHRTDVSEQLMVSNRL